MRRAAGADRRRLLRGDHRPTGVTALDDREQWSSRVAALLLPGQPRGSTIARFEGVVRCAGQVTLANIAVGSNGTFSVRRSSGEPRALIVSLEGRVSKRHGTWNGSRLLCDTRADVTAIGALHCDRFMTIQDTVMTIRDRAARL